jgi:tetratricopeptide (TPR) repeat protein
MKALFILSQQNIYLDIWKRIASSLGFSKIDVVSTGEDANNAFVQDNDYNLVICDDHLYGRLNGCVTFEGLRLSKRMKCTTAFMLTSSGTISDFYIMPLRTRPDFVVTKPYNSKAFENGIKCCLENLKETMSIREKISESDNEDALNDCIAANKIKPNGWIRNLHCEILFSSGRFSDVIEFCLKEIREYKSHWAIILLVQAYLSIERHSDAIKLINGLPEVLKSSATVLRLLSECYVSIGQFDLASTYLNKAIVACPDNHSFYDYQAEVSFADGEYKLSLRSIMRSIEMTMDTPLESKERYSKLSKMTFKYSEQDGEKDSKLMANTGKLMSFGYNKYPTMHEFNLCAQMFSVLALQYKGEIESAAFQFSEMVNHFSANKDYVMDSTVACQILSLSEGLPLSLSTREQVAAWVASDQPSLSVQSSYPRVNVMERADMLFAQASVAFKEKQLDEAERLIQKGLVLVPSHSGLNILLIEIFLELSLRNMHGIDRLINNSFRCFERIPVQKEDSPLYARYLTIKSELHRISMKKLND